MEKQLNLPGHITKESRFYKGNEELCKPYLGRPYLSYSSHSSLADYFGDFIKRKIAGIEKPYGVYADFGTYFGTAVEMGEFPEENPNGFTGQENLDLTREEGMEYEKMIIIDRGSYVILGFIDKYKEEEGVAYLSDLKTGGKGKEKGYKEPKYIQTTLYAYYIDKVLEKEIKETHIEFKTRTGSHVNPPLHLSEEQFTFALPYNKTRANYALKAMDKSAKEIASLKTTFDKYLK